MIEVLTGVRPGEDALLEKAFKLRHRVFVDERKWEDLRRKDGREVDQYDGPQCAYVLAIDDDEVIGHMRLTPTTHPHLLSDKHNHLCIRMEPRGPLVWEWTRYCVRPKSRGRSFWGVVAANVQVAAMEWLLMHGVRDVVVEYDPKFIERHLEMHFEVIPLGLPIEIDGDPVVAVHMRFDYNTLLQTRRVLGVSGPILKPERIAAAG